MVFQKLTSLIRIEEVDFGGELLRLFRKLALNLSYGACACAAEVALES